MVSPQMRAGTRLNQLAGNANPVTRLAYAPLENVAHAKVTADLFHVDGFALISEARIARDHKQPSYTRKRGDDFLHHTISEVFLFGIAAHILERQDGNRRFIGHCYDWPRRSPCTANPHAVDTHRPKDVLELLFARIHEAHVNL